MTDGLPDVTVSPEGVDSAAEGVVDVGAVGTAMVRTTGADVGDVRGRLTGVGWQLWADHCAATLARGARNGWSTALLVVDVDQFHEINNRFGRACGDSVLVEVARRLGAGFRLYDTIGRFGDTLARSGSDEFVIVCENVADAVTARSLGHRVADLLEMPVGVHDREVLVTAGVGVALAPPGRVEVEMLIKEADAAMRQAKRNGVAQMVFAADMRALGGETDMSEEVLRQAFADGELRLRYQPKVAVESGRIVGVEALLYWQHPQRGMVPPGEFIPLAEETGLIVAIGSWVIEEACRQAAKWRRSFPEAPALVVSVNVSACQFVPELVDVIARALSASALDPGTLYLEVTESLLMHDTDKTAAILGDLTGLGVSLSIDDFGTGYCSMSYLNRLPLRELKIDKSFVDGLGHTGPYTSIVAAIVAMAHAGDLSVVAEGVETADQLQRLRSLGCDQAQGYYLARPGPPDTIDVLLRAETRLGWRSHAPQAQHGAAEMNTYRPNRILVVDDDDSVRELARMSLAAAGFEVHEAVDGPSALSTATRVSPDCILLDVLMPGMSGQEVCRVLRGQPDTAECTILMLTIVSEVRDKIEAFSAGADDYIVKPFSPRDLVSRVHSAMRRRREDLGATIPPGQQPPSPPSNTPARPTALPGPPR